MSPNKPHAPLDELDIAETLNPIARSDRPADSVDLAPPATVRELTSTIVDLRGTTGDAATLLVERPASKPLPPPLPKPTARRRAWRRPLALVLATAGAATLAIVVNRPASVPQLPSVGDQVVAEGKSLRLDLAAMNRHALPPLQYELVGEVPPLAQLAADTGELIWPTKEWDGPSEQTLRVRATVAGQVDRASEIAFKVTVTETVQPPRFSPVPAVSQLKLEDGLYYLHVQARDRDIPGGDLTYEFDAEPPLAGSAWIDSRTGLFAWQPAPHEYGKSFRLVFRAQKPSTNGAESSLVLTLPEFGGKIEIGEGFSYQRLLTLLPDAAMPFELVASRAHHGGMMRLHRYQDSLVMIVEYESESAASQALPEYLARGDLQAPELVTHEGTLQLYHKNRLIVLTIGNDPSLEAWMRKIVRPPHRVVAATERSRVTAGGD